MTPRNGDTVLIVDDDTALLSTIGRTLELAGYRVLTAPEIGLGKRLCREHSIQAMLIDMQLGAADGFELLQWLQEEFPAISAIMITAFGSVEKAVRAIKMGAYDFLEKPIDRDRLLVTLRNALDKVHLEDERTGLLSSLQAQHEIIGNSPPMRSLRSAIDRAAPTDEKVLIMGETGAGKELVAQAIYSRSRRAFKPLVKVNCAAIPKDLIESELFGHRKGAFTGANDDHVGKFKLADGGTIFLDEIGDMSLDVQSKVLRALQDGEIEPVGGKGTEKVDVRVIAATNHDLEKLSADGRFRADLYFRLKTVVIKVPPLRDRLEDLPALMKHFLARAAERNNRPQLKVGGNALNNLLSHHWPGNVRELESLAAWLSVFVPGDEIQAEDLNPWFGRESEPVPEPKDYARSKEEFEREYFKRLLIALEGNMTAVAQAAHLDRSGLYRKLKTLGIVE